MTLKIHDEFRVDEVLGRDEDAILPLLRFMIETAAREARTPVDEARAVRNFWEILGAARVYVALDGAAIVGSLALRSVPATWYGPEEMRMLIDEWFVAADGVGRALMQRAVADSDGVPIIIRRLRKAVGRGVKADLLGYNVVGNIVQLR